MRDSLALIHTAPVVIPIFSELCKEILPGIQTFHMLDESLLKNTIAAGRLETSTIRRFVAYVQSAIGAGAAVVLCTCSSMGAAVKAARPLFDLPLIRVDEPMAEEAVRAGRKIGVIATVRTTLDPTTTLLDEKAAEAGVRREITSVLCEGAFEAASAGDVAAHDRLVTEALEKLVQSVDVVVLAQASMARIAGQIPKEKLPARVLSSPRPAVERVRDVLFGARAAAE